MNLKIYKKNLINTNSVSLHLRRNRFKSNDGKFGDQNYKGPVIFDDVINYVNRGIDYFRKILLIHISLYGQIILMI